MKFKRITYDFIEKFHGERISPALAGEIQNFLDQNIRYVYISGIRIRDLANSFDIPETTVKTRMERNWDLRKTLTTPPDQKHNGVK